MVEREAPLSTWAPRLEQVGVHSGGQLFVRELPYLTQLNVRTRDPGDLPPVGAVVSHGDGHLLGLGPDEWLAVAPPGRTAEPPADCSIVDVSAGRTTLVLSGPAVRGVLAHGCALDLDPARFAVGRCAETMLARAQVIIWSTAADEFRILLRPSFAPYLAAWLLDAAIELGRPTGLSGEKLSERTDRVRMNRSGGP
jgi:sarcosine oxidase subunit gamma